ncbi:hypothetical protein [Alcanivorax quisquiliarum]|uniref:Uncharacterized protein n=1 Tax=Alcanivorax quisquiliarum TaxID=2933565 RepID=A0ABT0E8B8_9GAMM|nr:hypothetical protein [Alcanivorax quisquiliarum]MCK0538087.1 hypothetical protein [Alcanivorax quisquiliarum]
MDIAPGTLLIFKPAPALQAQVVEGSRVEFMGETLSFSGAAIKAFRQIGHPRKVARGPDYWCWEGVTLTEWSVEKQV